MTATVDALIVGAGVVGLTTAVHLAEQGLLVEVRSRDAPERTTSAAAGAMWSMSYVEQSDRVLDWARCTLGEFVKLAGDDQSGVRLVEGVEASRTHRAMSKAMSLVDGVRHCDSRELPSGFVSGSRFHVPLVNMPIYLEYLSRRLLAAGGAMRIVPVECLVDVIDEAGIIVNCTGVDAAQLVPDPDLRPVRGQLVIMENPGITEFFAEEDDDDDLLYILPHGDTVVLGGTAEHGRWDLRPDPEAAASIVARCAEVFPQLASVSILDCRVGLRPSRRRVRCEIRQRGDGGWLGHNYGHGGAGVSLSWGCAHDLFDALNASW